MADSQEEVSNQRQADNPDSTLFPDPVLDDEEQLLLHPSGSEDDRLAPLQNEAEETAASEPMIDANRFIEFLEWQRNNPREDLDAGLIPSEQVLESTDEQTSEAREAETNRRDNQPFFVDIEDDGRNPATGPVDYSGLFESSLESESVISGESGPESVVSDQALAPNQDTRSLAIATIAGIQDIGPSNLGGLSNDPMTEVSDLGGEGSCRVSLGLHFNHQNSRIVVNSEVRHGMHQQSFLKLGGFDLVFRVSTEAGVPINRTNPILESQAGFGPHVSVSKTGSKGGIITGEIGCTENFRNLYTRLCSTLPTSVPILGRELSVINSSSKVEIVFLQKKPMDLLRFWDWNKNFPKGIKSLFGDVFENTFVVTGPNVAKPSKMVDLSINTVICPAGLLKNRENLSFPPFKVQDKLESGQDPISLRDQQEVIQEVGNKLEKIMTLEEERYLTLSERLHELEQTFNNSQNTNEINPLEVLLGSSLVCAVSQLLRSAFAGLLIGILFGFPCLVVAKLQAKAKTNKERLIWSVGRFVTCGGIPSACIIVLCNLSCNLLLKKQLFAQFALLETTSNSCTDLVSWLRFPSGSGKVLLPFSWITPIFLYAFYPLAFFRYVCAFCGLKKVTVCTLNGQLLTVVYLVFFHYGYVLVSQFCDNSLEQKTKDLRQWFLETSLTHPYLQTVKWPVRASQTLFKAVLKLLSDKKKEEG